MISKDIDNKSRQKNCLRRGYDQKTKSCVGAVVKTRQLTCLKNANPRKGNDEGPRRAQLLRLF